MLTDEFKDPLPKPFDQRRFRNQNLTWADSFEKPLDRLGVQIVEYLTGKRIAFRMTHEYGQRKAPVGSEFWSTVLDVMGIEVRTPDTQIQKIPKQGPTIVVANHPTGPLDGIILAEILRRVREDYKILTRDLMTVMETDFGSYLISVPFWHAQGAQKDGLEMRRQARAHVSSGGALAYFPSGTVATSENWFGPPVEGIWNVFTAKLIRDTGATVVPIRFHEVQRVSIRLPTRSLLS